VKPNITRFPTTFLCVYINPSQGSPVASLDAKEAFLHRHKMRSTLGDSATSASSLSLTATVSMQPQPFQSADVNVNNVDPFAVQLGLHPSLIANQPFTLTPASEVIVVLVWLADA
jgi:hypothetical protein